MVGLKQTKTQLGSLEDALHRTQLELERSQFALQAKSGVCF